MGSRLDTNSTAVRKRIENHAFENEEGDEYKGSKFGGFPEYFRRKKIKLQNLDAELRSQSVDKPQIFRGIVANVNGFTQPSLNDLHRMIVSYGGAFLQYLDGKTSATHIIASNLTPKKVVEFRKYRIVKPAWVVDSVKAGRLLPWDQYAVVDEGRTQKVLHINNGQVFSRTNDRPKGYRDQTDSSWYTSQLAINPVDPSTQLPIPEGSSLPDVDEKQKSPQALHASRAVVQDMSEEQHLDSRDFDSDDFPFEDYVDDLPLPTIDAEVEDVSHASLEKDVEDYHLRVRCPEGKESTEDYIHSAHGEVEEGQPTTVVSDAVVSHDDNNLYQDDAILEQEIATEECIHTPQGTKRKAEMITSPLSPSPKKNKLTAEEHNAILLADPRIRKSSTLNPDFLEQYYRESRLHHLSTWKADLKAQLQALTAEKSASQQKPQKRSPGSRRYILHVDFDSFFVAVSLKNYPQYKEVPACVAHGGGSGSEIASCNYPAREFGVKNGMWMKRAQELCKDLKVLPYDFPAYEAASRKFYDAIMATGGIVQSVSIDEALVDVSALCLPAGGSDGTGVSEGSIWREQAKAEEIAQSLRDQVKNETGCAVSVGIGGNILLAKVALRKAKPAGQYLIKPEEILDFLGILQVQDLPGVAYSIGGKLEEIGIKFVKDIREVTKERLINVLGPKTGEKIYSYARGIDRTEVGDQAIRKSVSAEVNWGVRFETQEQAEEFIESLCGELHRRLVKERVKGKQLTMKIMRRAADAPLDPPKHLGHGKCDTYNKSVVLGVGTNAAEVLTREALSILRGYGFSPGELRGLGVQMTKLEPIKPSADGDTASSQRRLQFKAATITAAPGIQAPGDVSNQVANDRPASSQRLPMSKAMPPPQKQAEDQPDDPIQDDIEPTKTIQSSHVTPAPPPGIGPSSDSPNRKPLNTLGTQFMLPTQVDPAVLAELPPDIRSKLARHVKQTNEASKAQTAPPGNAIPKRPPVASTALPAESQLDPDALQALPEDIREEILAHYATSPSGKSRANAGQSLLPQSPRKVRTIAPPRRGTSIRGRGRGGGSLLSRLKGVRSTDQTSTLTQSNFVATTIAARNNTTDDQRGATDSEGGGVSDADISPEFLAALPEDIRKEVLAQKRAEQLRRHGGLQVSAAARLRQKQGAGAGNKTTTRNSGVAATAMPRGERVFPLQALPPKPSFTTRKLSEAADLRGAVGEWVGVFGEDGPYEEDVRALGKYLGEVVGGERDIGKACGVVEWMGWVIGCLGGGEEVGSGSGKGREKWLGALEFVKGCVGDAVRARGLGKVEFDSFV